MLVRSAITIGSAGILLATLLTGCSMQGNSAKNWLAEQPSVTQVTLRLDGCSSMCDPVLTATLTDDVSEAEIRQLAADTQSFLTTLSVDNPGDQPEVRLNGPIAGLWVEETAEATALNLDEWARVVADTRITGATIGHEATSLTTLRAQVAGVFADYLGTGPYPVDVADASVNFRERAKGCAPTPEAMAEAATLMVDPALTSVSINLCGDIGVTVGEGRDLGAVRTHLISLVGAPGFTANTFSVGRGGTPKQPGGTSSVTLSAATEGSDAFLSALDTIPGLSDYESHSPDTYKITVDDPALLREVVTAVVALPKPAGVDSITFRSTGGTQIFEGADRSALTQLDLRDALLAVNRDEERLAVSMQPQNLAVTVHADLYTPKVGHRVIDAVLASGLWKDHAVTLVFVGSPNMPMLDWAAGGTQLPQDPDRPDTMTGRPDDLGDYWAARVGDGR